MVVEDFRARAARAGVAHGPEVIRSRDADDAIVGEAGHLAPQDRRLLVLGVDGDQQAVHRQAEVLADQLPGQLDRLFLEIVAEREVAEHLEEGVVAGGVADVIQVVVLAAGAHAALGRGRARGGPGLGAGEDVLERHHAGIDEQQGGIGLWHQGRRRHDHVIIAGEIAQKRAADLIQTRHRRSALFNSRAHIENPAGFSQGALARRVLMRGDSSPRCAKGGPKTKKDARR